jgi:hypothetical protein
MLLGGSALLVGPEQVPVSSDELDLRIDPQYDYGADYHLNLAQGQSFRITIVFNVSQLFDQYEAWPVITYRFPLKMVMEPVTRFINQSAVRFRIGWENSTFENIYVTGFLVRIFYFGSNEISVKMNKTKFANQLTPAGIGLVTASAIPFWGLVVRAAWKRRKVSMRFNTMRNG